MTRRAYAELFVLGAATGLLVLVAARTSLGTCVAVGVATACLALSVTVLHEVAHLAAARRRGLRVERLVVTGALSGYVERTRSDQPADEVAVALAGPWASVVLTLLGLVVRLAATGVLGLLGTALAWLAGLTVVASCPPLPGNDLSRAWAAWRHGVRPARRETSSAATPGDSLTRVTT